jgi:hypothetical protein
VRENSLNEIATASVKDSIVSELRCMPEWRNKKPRISVSRLKFAKSARTSIA